MGIAQGYKQTEVGSIPDDWGVKPLGSLAEISHGYGFESRHFASDGTYRLTTPGHFHEAGGFRDIGEKQKFYDGPLPAGYILEAGDLIVAMTEQADGLLGSAALVPCGEPYLHNQRLGRVERRTADVSLGFLYRVLNSSQYRSRVRETAAGTKVKHTSPGKLLEIAVPVPPTRAEQEAIAEALSDADALIESLEQLLAKKRQIKQGAMQELLTGKKRLPGFGVQVRTRRLDQLGIWTGGMTPSMRNRKYWDNGTVPWISSGDVKSARLATTAFAITSYAVKEGATTLIPSNSIITVTRSGILRKYFPVAINVVPMAINQDIKALIPHADAWPEYVLQALDCYGSNILSRCLKSGTTVESIEFPWLKAFSIPLPSLDEQKAIAIILTEMDGEIGALETKLAKARQIKQGMMQELLTGRIRLI